MNHAEYVPLAFDPKAFAQEKRQQSASFDAAYTAFDDEFAALAAACGKKLVIQMI
jgi:hypothetical protein